MVDRRVKSKFVCKEASFFAFVLKSLCFAKKNTKTRDLYKIRHYYVIYTKVINRTSLKSFREAVTQNKRTAPPGVDAAETVRFSWKVVGPQGQREHDVRVSR